MPPLRSRMICRPEPRALHTTAHSLSPTCSDVGQAMQTPCVITADLFGARASCYQDRMGSSGLDLILDQAAALIRSGQIAAAEQVYRKGLESFPANAMLLCNLAVTLCAQSRIRDALPFFDKAIDADPNHAPAYFNRGL